MKSLPPLTEEKAYEVLSKIPIKDLTSVIPYCTLRLRQELSLYVHHPQFEQMLGICDERLRILDKVQQRILNDAYNQESKRRPS